MYFVRLWLIDRLMLYLTTQSDYISWNDIMIDEMERIRKEGTVSHFQGTIPAFACRVRKTTKNLHEDSRYPGRDFKPGPPKYEARVLTSQRRHSVHYDIGFLYWGRRINHNTLRGGSFLPLVRLSNFVDNEQTLMEFYTRNTHVYA
jgi:hypothetical protein